MKKPQLTIIVIIILSLMLAGFIGQEFLVDDNKSNSHQVHGHANWAIVLNGERLDMRDEKYMQPFLNCQLDEEYVDPLHRTHMHDGNQDVIHVHHAGVTWGHLASNLNMSFGDEYFITDEGTSYFNTEQASLKFILNGKPIINPNNRIIDTHDKLLISYGPESTKEVIETQFPIVLSTAAEHQGKHDPASCSGGGEQHVDDGHRHEEE
jgi:hypothetical protein